MWEISVTSQAATVLFSICLGAILCLFYDMIRATRKAGINSFIAVFIGDIVFWLVSAFLVFIFLICTTNGEIRGYVVFFTALGFLIYRLTVGKVIYFVLEKVFCFFARIFDKFLISFSKFCYVTEKYISMYAVLLLRTLKKLLKSIYNMVYTTKDKTKAGNDLGEQGN